MMKRINRQISSFACALAVLIWTCAPAQAQFRGRFHRGQPWLLDVTAATGNTDDTAVTVFYLGQDVDAELITSVKPGDNFLKGFAKIPRHVKRIIIELDLPGDGSGSALVGVSQGFTRFEETSTSQQTDGRRWVLDVADEP